MSDQSKDHREADGIDDLAPPHGADFLTEWVGHESAQLTQRLNPVTVGRMVAEMHPFVAATVVMRMEPPTASRSAG